MESGNVVWQQGVITRQGRERLNGHQSMILWFTGLSGAGKSTLAHAVEVALHERRVHTFVLDGDNVRHGLCADLGFSDVERGENIRRVSQTAKLFLEAGVVILSAFISPFRADRSLARAQVAPNDFLEIYCRCPLAVCEQRDVKGLYKRARAGEITCFTGISSLYEEPETPELVVDTGSQTLETCVAEVLELLRARGLIV